MRGTFFLFPAQTSEKTNEKGGRVLDQSKWKKIGGGLALGAANSLFGGGGGMLAVPLLRAGGLPERKAHATAILVILPICLSSLFLYFFFLSNLPLNYKQF